MKALLVGLALLLPGVVRAQWSPLPNGSAAYTFSYESSATFSCGATQVLNSCLASGNSISFFNGTANATLSFTGVSETYTIARGGIREPGFALGVFTLAFGGVGAFTWPPAANPLLALFGVRVLLTETAPIVSVTAVNRHFRLTSPTTVLDNCCDGDGRSFQWAITPPPVGGPGLLVVDPLAPLAFDVNGPSTVTMTGAIGIVPEPSTWAMLVVGLSVVGLVRRRRNEQA